MSLMYQAPLKSLGFEFLPPDYMATNCAAPDRSDHGNEQTILVQGDRARPSLRVCSTSGKPGHYADWQMACH